MAFYDEWTEEYRQELKDAGAQFSGNVPISGLNIAMQEVEGAYDEETDTGFTEKGTGSFLATVNPRYQAQSEAVESEEYQRFVEYLELRRPEALATHGALELWNQNQRGLVSGTPLFADQQGLIAGGTGGFDEGSGGGGGGGDTASIRAEMQDAFYMALRLSGIPKADIDSLWAWAEGELVNDPSFTAERALIGMYDSDAFKKRFPAIRALNDLVEAGGTQRSVPTPGEYIAFEKDVMNELSRFGVEISEAVQDSGQGFDDLIESLYMNSVGFAEVTERLTTAEKAMHNMPPEVRDALIEWFGSDWASSISMKTFLDPKDDWSQVQDDIRTAETGGWGRMKAGLDAGWNRDLARQVSDLGLSQRDQWLKFVDLKEEELLYSEKLTEDEDLDYGTNGVRAAFDLKADDGFASGLELSDLITKRELTRKAEFRGGGGAMITQSTTGFGAANV